MESGTTSDQEPLHESTVRYDIPLSATTEIANKHSVLQSLSPSYPSAPMVDANNEHQALFVQGGVQEDFQVEKLITTLLDEHIWVIGLLTGVVIVLVVLSCSLRSNYFQENYFVTRAKEWVHLPLLHQSGQDSLLTAETGVGTNEDAGPEPEAQQTSETAQPSDLSWVSETSESKHLGEMKSSWAEDELDDDQETKLMPDMSALSLKETCTDQIETTERSSSPYDSDRELLKSSFKAQKNHFVFNADIFLTKSESLDEARTRSQLREKCFKANKSVDEILSRQEQPVSSSTDENQHQEQQNQSTSSIPCTPKCRKLQERRGSNHSLTIAVKPTDANILPTVVTPRECSAAQFLLTAGNCMNRQQLRSCLKDVKSLHAEFWSIPTNAPELVDQVSGCAIKNRYRYVLPNPQSRVKLPVLDPSDPTSGYINGNYVRAQNGDARAYIATQGPLNNTINDFWLMVWVEKAPAIVMITKLVESGKAKCEPYLPADGETCRYGDVIVSVGTVEDSSGCDVRHLSLKRDGEEGIHCVTHYWYTDWPDHKTPDNPRTLVDLAVAIESLRRGQSSLLPLSSSSSSPTEEASSSSSDDSTVDDTRIGPIVVHCSAGVGRTGCFIAVCQGLSQLVTEGKVDILGIVCALRCDRGGMVQTAEQYEFIHRGLCLFEKSTMSDYAGD